MNDTHPMHAERERLASLTAEQLVPTKLQPALIGRALDFAFGNFLTLLRLSLPLLVMLAAATFLIIPQLAEALRDRGLLAEFYGDLVFTAVYATAGALYAVAIHRWIILGERPGPGVYLRFTRGEFKFAAATVLALVIVDILAGLVPSLWLRGAVSLWLRGAVTLPGMPIAVALGLFFAVCCLVLWLLARLCLVFPHAAVTGRLWPGLSWRAMRGHFWSWFFIFLLLSIVLAALSAAVFFILNIGLLFLPVDYPLTILDAANTALLIVFIGFSEAASIAALSLIYQEITRAPAAAAE